MCQENSLKQKLVVSYFKQNSIYLIINRSAILYISILMKSYKAFMNKWPLKICNYTSADYKMQN